MVDDDLISTEEEKKKKTGRFMERSWKIGTFSIRSYPTISSDPLHLKSEDERYSVFYRIIYHSTIVY